jgi:hypothetical protein
MRDIFLAVGLLVGALAVILGLSVQKSNVGFAREDVVSATTITMKIVSDTMTSSGRRLELVNRSGNDALVLFGSEADAVAAVTSADGTRAKEIRLIYETKRTASPDGKGFVLTKKLGGYYRAAYDAELW